MTGIWGPNGDWIDFAAEHRDGLTTEFATRLSAGDGLSAFLDYLPDPDPVLRNRGDDSRVLEDLTADDQVCMALQVRKLRVLNMHDYDFKPGLVTGQQAESASIQLCDTLTGDLEKIRLRDVFGSILDTPFYGPTWLELLWEPEGKRLRLVDIQAKPRHWFGFNSQNQPVFRGTGMGTAMPLPANKFVVVRHFPTYENPYGLRLLTRCLWPVAFKRGGVRFLTRFLEKYGLPWLMGKAPRQFDRRQRQQMAGDLAGMIQDAVAVLPAGAEVELTTVSGSAGETHERYLKRWDKAISKVLMGQTLTAEMDGSGGSRAAAEIHYAVSEDIAAADQFMVMSAMNDIAMIYRDVNAAPGVLAPVFGYNEPEDRQEQAKLGESLGRQGVRFTKAHFIRRYDLAEEEFEVSSFSGEESSRKPPQEAAGSSRIDETDLAHAKGVVNQEVCLSASYGSYDEGAAQGGVEGLVEKVLSQAVTAHDLPEKISELVRSARSYEDLMERLEDVLPEWFAADESSMDELLTRALAAADLWGRLTAGGEMPS